MFSKYYIEQRLERWSVWYHMGPRPGPQAVISSWGLLILNPNVAQRTNPEFRAMLADPTEAVETDEAVRALAEPLRKTVVEIYINTGTIDQKARALHCCRMTIDRRLGRAIQELAGLIHGIQLRKRCLAHPGGGIGG